MESTSSLPRNAIPTNEEHFFDLNELPLEYPWEIEEHIFHNGDVEGEHEDSIIDLTVNQVDEENERQETTVPGIPNNYEQQPNKKRCLSNGQRKMVYSELLARSANRKLKRNTSKEVSSLLSMPVKTVRRIWKQAKDTPPGVEVDVSHRKTKNSGRKRLEVDFNQVLAIPFRRRRTLRSLAEALQVSCGTLHGRFKEGLLRRHSNAIRPCLKEENKIARLRFCLSMLEEGSVPHEPKFQGMYNVVHIDEKWFYMTKKSNSYYMLPQEEEPLRVCQSKNFIGKVMFLTAIARPRFDHEGNEVFSGKIGLFPLVTKQPAMRRSRNREAETLETKPITSVTKEVIRAFLVDKVIPAIRSIWPIEDSRETIFIQQDNARTHVHPRDEEFQRVASQNGFDIKLRCQPANSPNLNVLDLGFFNAIQSLQDKQCSRTVDELIHAVENAFAEYPTSKINHVFLSLQLCMWEIMKHEGGNNFKIPHINKVGLERSGRLPKQITCDYETVEKVMNHLATRNEG